MVTKMHDKAMKYVVTDTPISNMRKALEQKGAIALRGDHVAFNRFYVKIEEMAKKMPITSCIKEQIRSKNSPNIDVAKVLSQIVSLYDKRIENYNKKKIFNTEELKRRNELDGKRTKFQELLKSCNSIVESGMRDGYLAFGLTEIKRNHTLSLYLKVVSLDGKTPGIDYPGKMAGQVSIVSNLGVRKVKSVASGLIANAYDRGYSIEVNNYDAELDSVIFKGIPHIAVYGSSKHLYLLEQPLVELVSEAVSLNGGSRAVFSPSDSAYGYVHYSHKRARS
ncbi:MAG: hypothetical protein NTV88_00155 [Candidatus Micrarchaeota archaeon]|nr:hypothetical protein [Candidatus Micrarchaeota archaeon]